MSNIIKTIDFANKESISDRDVNYPFYAISSIDSNQVTGEILLTDSAMGSISIYPPSPMSFDSSEFFMFFGVAGTLRQPHDAKFDYVRRKVWIADTGNDRVLKISPDKTNDVEVIIDDLFYKPFSISPNFNNGGCFIKAFSDSKTGLVIECSSDGEELSRYEYSLDDNTESSSSSSESGNISSSSSSLDIISIAPSCNVKYDHVRKKIWWGNNSILYMVDQGNYQIKTFYLSNYIDIKNLDIELNTGCVFVVATDIHEEDFVLQINRNNNLILASAYIGKI